jgi:hypothetical protein
MCRKSGAANQLKVFNTTPAVIGLLVPSCPTNFTSLNISLRYCHGTSHHTPSLPGANILLGTLFIFSSVHCSQKPAAPVFRLEQQTKIHTHTFRNAYCADYGEGDEQVGHDGGPVSRVP